MSRTLEGWRRQKTFILFGTPHSLSVILRAVTEPILLQGRPIRPAELAQIRQLQAAPPNQCRTRLSRALTRLRDWLNTAGRFTAIAARTLLLKLEQRGWIVLLPRQRTTPRRIAEPSPGRAGLARIEATPAKRPTGPGSTTGPRGNQHPRLPRRSGSCLRHCGASIII